MINSQPMNQTLGEVIEARLGKLGISQKELSNRTGMSTAQISRIISGERGIPRLDNLLAIADALGMERDAILKIAAGERYERAEEEDDPWVVEMNARLLLITSTHLRRIAKAMLQRIVDEERAAEDVSETKPRRRPAT